MWSRGRLKMHGFITQDNIYYEAEHRVNEDDLEVPLRPNQGQVWSGDTWVAEKRKRPVVGVPDHDSDFHYRHTDYQPEPYTMSQKDGVFENISWKDLITILYFLAGLAGMWFHMSERTLIIEQKLQVMEKEIASLKETHKEYEAKTELQIKQQSTQLNELSLLFLRQPQSKD